MLIGREAEVQKLKFALSECAANKARTVVIEGPVGCGKSELLEAAAANAAIEGAMVLRAAALQSESALPLGVMRQLVDSTPLPAESGRRLQALLDEDETSVDPHLPDQVPPARAARMQKFCAALHEVVRSRLVLIGIDDLQHVDTTSLQYLLYIASRSRSTRLMMVFTEALYYRQRVPTYRTEFLRQPNFQRIRLECLDRGHVAELLASYTHSAPDESVVDDYCAVTGGNPLLLRALQEDRLMTHIPDTPSELLEPSAGDAFAHAALTCLERSGPLAVKVADGLAVLGESATLDLVSRLCELPRVAAAQGMRALRAAGVVDDCRFRHSATRAGVLDGMDAEERHRMHRRAAALLYADSAPPSTVAPHLLAADSFDEPWSVPVLQDAAEEVLADDDVRSAISYLELAHRFCTDPQQQVEIRIRTAVITRRSNPSMAEKLACELLGALREGRVPPQHYVALADLFIGHRRVDEASEIFNALRDLEADADSGLVQSSLPLVRIAESYYPWAAWRMVGRHQGDTGSCLSSEPLERNDGNHAGNLPWAVPPPVPADRDDVTAAAEEMLRCSVLTDLTLEPICSAIKCLLLQGRTDRALYWSDLFLKETVRRDTVGWFAMFAGLRAEIALQQGDLQAAEEYTQAALRQLPEKGGVLAAGLTATQVQAQTARGNFEAGARQLNQPASEALFGSAYGLTYLRARGHYHLATNRLNVALDDFLTVGQMAQGWGLDQPTWVPWRGDVAETLLQLGERKEAERLATEQLRRSEGANARIRGISLRVLGAASEPGERLPTLTRAVAQLQVAGDRLELARALYDLGEAHKELGDLTQATLASRRAWQLAKECGAEPLCARIRLEHSEEIWDGGSEEETAPVPEVRLSDSEKRVAALAACGYTNRDISSRLYITVSTVEQHLTRVYRKLKIGGRQQLPTGLQFEVTENA